MIRLEEKKDTEEVNNLTREAFWNVYRPGCCEHFILHRLRTNACFVPELTFVYEKDGKIIAHIAYAKGQLEKSGGQKEDLLLFGPVSVLPSYQKKGYGARLIMHSIERAKEMGYPAIVITGNPDYYKKFGFQSASKHAIYYRGINPSEEFPFFMLKVLDKEKARHLTGVYSDPASYAIDDDELAVFDARFPTKVKQVLPGQLA